MEMDERIVAQSGRFTLHGCGSALEGLKGSDSYIRKFLVPANMKQKLRVRLQMVGVQGWSLFPDLQSLADGLKNREYT
jgi:hypothetical protein